MTDWRMDTEDRVAQVSWLEELAGNIATNLDGDVEYALGEGAYTWGIELPDWFDDHDRGLLVTMVQKRIQQ